jgi:predicted dienelactone hydrolase
MRIAWAVALGLVFGSAHVASAAVFDCLSASGKQGQTCLAAYTKAVDACRKAPDAACEAELRAEPGPLSELLEENDAPIADACTEADAETLGYLGVDDVQIRIDAACVDFAEDALALAYADDLAALDPGLLRCQRAVAKDLARLRAQTVKLFGRGCFLKTAKGKKPCNREKRDAAFERLQGAARKQIAKRCKTSYDPLGLGPLDDLVAATATHARHFAIQVFPPNDLGPTGTFGPHPIGVTTLALADASRTDVAGTGPRPVVTEVFYPTTGAATAGVPRDVVTVLGVPITETPAYRDVDRASGEFPLVVFSHGNEGIRIQSLFLAFHLASHGYVVASPDHHGNTFIDDLAGIDDGFSAVNRPLDMSFLIDEMLALDAAPSGRFAGGIDADRIGAAGHSFGGYTVFALAAQAPGTPPPDPRVKAILPQAPAAPFEDDFFAAIGIPVLIMGGSIDGTTPFATNQQRPFDLLPSGAPVVGLARLRNAGHFTFSNYCDVDRELLGFLGGFAEACQPRHLPWRHAHEIANHLAVNFFDAVLRDDAAALGRLQEAVDGTIDDLDLTLK